MPNEIQQLRDEVAQLKKILGRFFLSDRIMLDKTMQMLDGRNIQIGKTTGTKFGTETSQKIGFYNKTPIIQPSSTGESTGFTAGGGTAVTHTSTFTGNSGTTAYTLSDLVKHLKLLGLLTS